jgi:hypothetical protein
MSIPTTSTYWNQTTPAVPSGDQSIVIQTDNATPQDSRTGFPKTATASLRGVVKPDGTTIQVDAFGNITAKAMVGDSGSGGSAGIVPAPPAGSASLGKFLNADGTFKAPAGIASVQQEAYTYAADTGSVNAYAVTLSPAPTIVAGSRVQTKAAHANTGSSTLSVNGTVYPLVKDGFNPLIIGDITGGQIIDAVADGVGNFQAIGLAPALVLTPVIRGSSFAASIGSSYSVALPAGSQVGDFTLLFAASGFAPSVPTGWTSVIGTAINIFEGFVASKTLTLGDIATVMVTVAATGSYDGGIALVTFVGATGGVREGAHGVSITSSNAILSTDVAIYWDGNRGGSGTGPTITPSSGFASTLQSGSTTNARYALADQPMPGGVISVVFQRDSECYSAYVIVTGASSVLGSVSSVGLTVPSRQSISGSPVISSGTLAITDNVQSTNLVFAGPSSGGAAAPTFRAVAAADLPLATTGAFGAVKPDGSTITVAAGVISSASASTTHSESLTDGSSNFIFASGDIVTVIGVPNQ